VIVEGLLRRTTEYLIDSQLRGVEELQGVDALEVGKIKGEQG